MKLPENNNDVDKACSSIKAIAQPYRLKTLCFLKEEEKTVLEIVDEVGSSQSNISQHIDRLRDKGILTSRRDGNKIYCSITDPKILPLINSIQDTFCSSTSTND